MERRLNEWSANNDLSLYQTANNDPNLGHPVKALKPVYPMTRFYQENKTEIFEIDCDGNQFEMFEFQSLPVLRIAFPTHDQAEHRTCRGTPA